MIQPVVNEVLVCIIADHAVLSVTYGTHMKPICLFSRFFEQIHVPEDSCNSKKDSQHPSEIRPAGHPKTAAEQNNPFQTALMQP